MHMKHLSKQDAIILLELISESLACSTEEQVLRLMGRLSALLPYQAAVSCMSKLGANGEIETLKVVNVDYPEDYLAELGKSGLIMKDPVVMENFRSFRLQYWADTFKQRPISRDTNEIISLAEDFGFSKTRAGCGYGHGVRNLKGTEGSFFCYQGLLRSRRTEEILNIIIPHFHEALRRAGAAPKAGSPLTAKETEVLKWVKQGKSTWDISTILGISERTVKFHVGNILQKLDATTRTHAVAIALEQGLVDIE
jgi:LuxR family transcriptional regulator, quorum-sensing system regulator CviR